MRERPKMFVLCADDFAINEAVSRAILDLVDAGRLTAVSVIVSTPLWAEIAGELATRRDQVAIGLHLDLTRFPSDGPPSSRYLRRLVLAALSGRLDAGALSAEFERQFDCFEAALGHAPDHVDGHHHIHALPQIRDALFSVLAKRFAGSPAELRPLARDPTDSIFRILRRGGARAKALAVASLCAGFGARAAALGIATNVGFAGFSRFAGVRRRDWGFDQVLRAPGPRHLVMCHPGLAESAASRADPIAASRSGEYRRLMASEAPPRAMLTIRRGRDGQAFGAGDWVDRGRLTQ